MKRTKTTRSTPKRLKRIERAELERVAGGWTLEQWLNATLNGINVHQDQD